jgi:hypothetical protein
MSTFGQTDPARADRFHNVDQRSWVHAPPEVPSLQRNTQLTGKVAAVVTGGTSGIGLAIAHRFVAEGAQVFITGRRKVQLDAATAELGTPAVAVQCDVSDLADLDRLYDVVREQAGRIEVLVINASEPRSARDSYTLVRQSVLEAERGADHVHVEHRAQADLVEVDKEIVDLHSHVVREDVQTTECVDYRGDGLLQHGD